MLVTPEVIYPPSSVITLGYWTLDFKFLIREEKPAEEGRARCGIYRRSFRAGSLCEPVQKNLGIA